MADQIARSGHKRQHIPLKLKFEIQDKPCTVCGVPYFIRCDHIVPVRLGGGSEPSNLQPLCWDCNHAKTYRLTNEQLRYVIAGRGMRHFQHAVWREDTRYENSFDRRSLVTWQAQQPERVQYAASLYLAFLGRCA